MKHIIINAYVADCRNIGDQASSPVQYFDFNVPVETLDLRALNPNFKEPKSGFGGSITLDQLQQRQQQEATTYHLIVGGGGLLFDRFLGSFEQIRQLKSVFNGKWIAWGPGQQVYATQGSGQSTLIEELQSKRDRFNYPAYLDGFNHIGIRDAGFTYPWLPCVSCMDPTFDRPRQIKHDYVVFSHRKFQIKLKGLPAMSHDTQNLEEVIDFLGSGETIISSSYHGVYWGLLLGRKVLAFPFSTKFVTLKHAPSLYPVPQWVYSKFKFRPFKKTFLNKINIEFRYGDKYTCRTKNWPQSLMDASAYPDMLEESREANRQFHRQVLNLLAADR